MDSTRNIVPTSAQAPRVARLTRHLKARLEDFGPGGPEVVQACLLYTSDAADE